MLVWLIHIIQQHLLLLVATGLWDLSKCIEKVIKLSLFHLDKCCYGSVNAIWGGKLAYNTLVEGNWDPR